MSEKPFVYESLTQDQQQRLDNAIASFVDAVETIIPSGLADALPGFTELSELFYDHIYTGVDDE